MKKLAALLIAITSLLSGCVVYDPYRDDGRHSGQGGGQPPHRADHDRDGVPDNRDRSPNNPNRY
jgi:hypothetical protein